MRFFRRMRRVLFSGVFFVACVLLAPPTPVHAALTYIHEEISGDVVWTKAHGPYIVAGVIIPEGSSLTIEPGVIIKASTWATLFQVTGGTLTVGAPDAERVIITSLFDDTVDGDTNEDGDATSPYPGHWNSIMILSGQATLTNVTIKYGNKDGIYGYGQVFNENGTVSCSDVEFSLSGGVGLYAKGGVTEVYDSSFLDNSRYGIRQQGGGILRFGRNTFQRNNTAVYIQGSTTVFENSGGNSGEGSILLHSISIQDDHAVFPADGLAYYPVAVGIPVGKTLTLEPGVIVKVIGTAPFGVLGTLNVGAPDAEPVVFTSSADDTVGGDTNVDDAATAPKRGDWGYITSHSGGVITMTNTIMRYGGSSFGTIVNQGGDITLNDVRVSESLTDLIYQQSGTLSATNSEFSNAPRGVRVDRVGGSVQIHESSFHDLTNYGISNTSSIQVDAKNNWWGDASGPWHITHPEGLGAKLNGNIDFAPWKGCFRETCHSSVLFLPGLEASRLYEGDKKLWEPYENADTEKLFLTSEGKSKAVVTAKDIIDHAYAPVVGNVYESFIKDMDKMAYTDHFIKDWKSVAYDWRLSFDDVLADGLIENTLRNLAQDSHTGKVTIIAHSNGGLLAKALIKKLETAAPNLIDTLVLVAVPQSGTPQAIGALLHGYEQGLPVNWMPFTLSPYTARMLANNMPGAYPLLPSHAYFSGESTGVRTPVITFEDGVLTQPWINTFGYKIKDDSELRDFLLSIEGKISADSENIVTPSTINSSLLSYGTNVHQAIDDDQMIPESIVVYQIAGTGEETLASIRYWTDSYCVLVTGDHRCAGYAAKLAYTPDERVDGDGTVVTPSALSLSQYLPNVKRFWVNLDKYNEDVFVNRKHADILEVDSLRDFIKDAVILGASTVYSDYISDSEPDLGSEKRLRYYLHSPLALSIKDAAGHIVSTTASDIPGAHYKRFGEVQYISVPASVHPTVVLDGEAEGSFTLEVKEVAGDTMLADTTFAAIPNTADTVVTMDFPDGTLEHADPLIIDYDGNGEVDLSLEPKIGEVVTTTLQDTVSPVTTLSASGIQGTNNWYTSDVAIVLSAMDNENGSGVDKTEYSLDNGTTWIVYLDPVTIATEGITRLQYRSTDKAKNQEAAKIETISIDKTAPEAKISFNPTTQKLDISGTDNLSDVSVVIVDKPDMKISHKKMKNIKPWFSRWHDKHKGNLPDMLATITDQAGHTTSLSFEKTKDRRGFVFVRLLSLGYDGTETMFKDTDAQYKWRIDKKKQYRLFASSLRTGETRIESHYIPKKNETWIMEKSEGLRDDDQDEENERNERDEERAIKTKLPGMVVPYMESKAGEIVVKY
ncbi:MAG: right-handed parallel beta-helix repeat-containing protein [Candidatus Moraniibacteriota bacterium]